jgi:thiamine-monophosphate kinase
MNEKELLRHIQKISHRTGYTYTGDDAATLRFSGADSRLVVSTDQFIENTHFTWDNMTGEEVGHKGLVQALSDLAAMAATPIAVLCSAAWPQAQQEKILQIFKGIEAACLQYHVPLVGGDISHSSALQTYLDFTVIGQCAQPLLKNGAKPGDLIAVSGPLGGAFGGFRCLTQNLNFSESAQLLNAFKNPRARIDLAKELAPAGVITSLTDISDSLCVSLSELSTHSGCGLEIALEAIPRLPALESLCEAQGWPLKDFLLGGGEDYELLMTLDKNTAPSLMLDHGLVVIGKVTTTTNSYSENKKIYPLPELGWDPFTL